MSMENNTKKILMGVGAAVLVGLGLYVYLKNGSDTEKETLKESGTETKKEEAIVEVKVDE